MTHKYSNKSELRSELFSEQNKSLYLAYHGTQTLLSTDVIHVVFSIQASKGRDDEGFTHSTHELRASVK